MSVIKGDDTVAWYVSPKTRGSVKTAQPHTELHKASHKGSSGESNALGIAGASGCVIGKEAADRLGLQQFGGMAVSGMAGRLESCFRRADSLQLGPVTISNCLFM